MIEACTQEPFTTFQLALYYIFSTIALLSHLTLWIFYQREWKNFVVIAAGYVLTFPYLVILIRTAIVNVTGLLNWTPQGIRAQYDDGWLVVASTLHYLQGDLFCALFIIILGQHFEVNRWKILPILILTFAFAPVGCFIALIVFTRCMIQKQKETRIIQQQSRDHLRGLLDSDLI
jgi:hypothetical protein